MDMLANLSLKLDVELKKIGVEVESDKLETALSKALIEHSLEQAENNKLSISDRLKRLQPKNPFEEDGVTVKPIGDGDKEYTVTLAVSAILHREYNVLAEDRQEAMDLVLSEIQYGIDGCLFSTEGWSLKEIRDDSASDAMICKIVDGDEVFDCSVELRPSVIEHDFHSYREFIDTVNSSKEEIASYRESIIDDAIRKTKDLNDLLIALKAHGLNLASEPSDIEIVKKHLTIMKNHQIVEYIGRVDKCMEEGASKFTVDNDDHLIDFEIY